MQATFLPQWIDGASVCARGDSLFIVWPSSSGLFVQELGDKLDPHAIVQLVPWDALRRRIYEMVARPDLTNPIR